MKERKFKTPDPSPLHQPWPCKRKGMKPVPSSSTQYSTRPSRPQGERMACAFRQDVAATTNKREVVVALTRSSAELVYFDEKRKCPSTRYSHYPFAKLHYHTRIGYSCIFGIVRHCLFVRSSDPESQRSRSRATGTRRSRDDSYSRRKHPNRKKASL